MRKKTIFIFSQYLVLSVRVNPLSANPTKWSNTLNNSSAVADELFECI